MKKQRIYKHTRRLSKWHVVVLFAVGAVVFGYSAVRVLGGTFFNITLGRDSLEEGLIGHWTFDTNNTTAGEGTASGATWTEAVTNAAWSNRYRHDTLVYGGRMWVINGYASSHDDVWYSTDGANWTLATDATPWGARQLHGLLAYDGKMWIMGGIDNATSTHLNDVWYTTDGVNWTQAATDPDGVTWGPRYGFAHVVYDGKMWIMGGQDGTYLDDVWYSTDGVTWTEATADAPWEARYRFNATVYDGKMWIMGGDAVGGEVNDVWWSTDGVSWTQATASAAWSLRERHGVVTYNSKMWVIGGDAVDGTGLDDVWYSTDGVTWTAATEDAPWPGGAELSPLVYDGRMWIMGGTSSSGVRNDVWYSSLDQTATGFIPDVSSGTNNGTASGGALAIGKVGQGFSFDGVDDTITIPDSSLWDFAGKTRTISFWTRIDPRTYPGCCPMFLDHFTGGSPDAGWTALLSDVQVNHIFFSHVGSGDNLELYSTSALNDDKWHHVLVTLDGSTGQMYIDGVLSDTDAYSSLDDHDEDLKVGTEASGIYFKGGMDDLRIYDRVLSAGEIKRVYHLGATTHINTTIENESGLLEEGLVLHYTLDGVDTTTTTATDVSGNGNDGSIKNGAAIAVGKIGQGLRFDGTDDYTAAPDSSSLAPLNDMAIALWVKLDSLPPSGTYPKMVVKIHNSSPWRSYELYIDGDVKKPCFAWVNTSGSVFFVCSNQALEAGRWYHIVALKSDEIMQVWVNGDEDSGKITNATGTNLASDYELQVGSQGGGNVIDGVIDDVRIYNRTLLQEQIDRLYELGATTHVNTTLEQPTLTSGLAAHYTFDGADTTATTASDTSGNGNDGTTNGAVRAIGMIGQGMSFDGVDDYISVPSDASLNLAGADHSFSFWFKTSGSTDGNAHFIDRFTGGTPGAGYVMWMNSSGSVQYQERSSDGSNINMVPPGRYDDGEWHHMAVTIDVGAQSGEVYIDGDFEENGSYTGTLIDHSGALTIGGRTTGNSYNGFIDDVRIYTRELSASEVERLYKLGIR